MQVSDTSTVASCVVCVLHNYSTKPDEKNEGRIWFGLSHVYAAY